MSVKSESIRTIRGGQRFLNDMTFPRLLETRLILSDIFKGRFTIPALPALPPGASVFFAADIPGRNTMTRGRGDLPLLAPGVVRYRGQPLGVAAGEDPEALEAFSEQIDIAYAEEIPTLNLETDAERAGGDSLSFTEGLNSRSPAPPAPMAGEYAVRFQEYHFPEAQSAVALWEKKALTIYCPTKNPFHVLDNVSLVLGVPQERLCLVVPDAVEDPGEKETLPALIASLAALVAWRTGRAARVTLSNTIKQYPALVRLSSALDARGRLAGTRAEIFLDMGAAVLPSPNLFRRAVYCLPGPYQHNGLSLAARAVLTDKTPYTRPLSGGAAEACFAIETHMTRLARFAGTDPLTFRRDNLARAATASDSSSGADSAAVAGAEAASEKIAPADRVIEEAAAISDFRRKYAAFEVVRPTSERPLASGSQARGIGSALAYYGFDFIEESESKERHSVTLTLEKDGTLRILTSALEIGQVVRRLFTAIAARTLEIDPDDIVLDSLDTSLVPDSGPMYETHAVTSIGRLIEQACLSLRRKRGKTKQALSVTRTDSLPAFRARRGRSVFHQLDAPALSWCATVVEVEVDPASLRADVKGVWAAIECGVLLCPELAAAQAEREVRRAWDGLENTSGGLRHKLRANRTAPPVRVSFIELPYAQGPLGAKGLGELPGLGVAPAFTAAISQALGREIGFWPVSAPEIEDLAEGG